MNKIISEITIINRKIIILTLMLLLATLVYGCQAAEISPEEQPTAEVPVAAEPPAAAIAQPEPTSESESAETGEFGDQLTADVVAETKGVSHFVDLTENGFKPDMLTISAGDKVVWQNVRIGQINKAMVIGVRECGKIRSGFMYPGDSFSWTFDQPAVCTIVDGIMTTVQSKIIVK